MNNRKLASFQRQIETVLKVSMADLDLRIRRLFTALRIKTHLTSAEIRKWDGYAPIHLMFVLLNLLFQHVLSVHGLTKRFVAMFYRARKDTFYCFKNSQWSWRPFYWSLIRHLGTRSIGQRLRKKIALLSTALFLPNGAGNLSCNPIRFMTFMILQA